MNHRVVVGLKSNSMHGLKSLAEWVFEASPKLLGLKVSNIYRSDSHAVNSAWPSQLWMAVCYSSGPRLGETGLVTWVSSDFQSVESILLIWENEVNLVPGQPLPNPQLVRQRIFLQCAAEVAGDLVHPVLGKTLVELVNQDDRPMSAEFFSQGVKIFETPTL